MRLSSDHVDLLLNTPENVEHLTGEAKKDKITCSPYDGLERQLAHFITPALLGGLKDTMTCAIMVSFNPPRRAGVIKKARLMIKTSRQPAPTPGMLKGR